MATDKTFIDFVTDQMAGAGDVSSKKMFGEYAVYCGGKVVALACDNRLYVKPTAGGRTFIGSVTEAPPYPGAKPMFLIEDQVEDIEWLTELVRVTAAELPFPKPKKKTGKRKKK